MRIKIDGLKSGCNNFLVPEKDITGTVINDFIVKKSRDMELEIQKSGNYIHITGEAQVGFTALCDRCAEDYEISQVIKIDYMFHIGILNELSDDIVTINPSENEGYLDFLPYFSEAFILTLPVRQLCSEECKGICQNCGKNRNEGDCGCNLKKQSDPRWETLTKILNKNGET